MKKRLLIFGIVILAAVAFIFINRLGNSHEEGVLLLSGNVEVTETNIGFKTSGRIKELLADEGQRVSKGDRLVQLENSELESLVIQNKEFLNETIDKLEGLKAGSRPQELEQAKANLNNAKAELVKAKKDIERAEALLKDELISAEQMDSARKAYDMAVSQKQKALEALSLVKEGPRQDEIKAAESRMRQAQAALKVSEERFNDSILYAPVTGKVLRKNAEAGEVVSSGIPVYTIGDLDNPWIRVYIKEDRLGFVKLGQKAEIRIDSFPNKAYEGKVTYIASEAEFTPRNVQTKEERVRLVFGVKVSVKNINNELKPGMPADVKILINPHS